VGPFDDQGIIELLEKGTLNPEDMVWHEGLAEWAKVEEAFEEKVVEMREKEKATSATFKPTPIVILQAQGKVPTSQEVSPEPKPAEPESLNSTPVEASPSQTENAEPAATAPEISGTKLEAEPGESIFRELPELTPCDPNEPEHKFYWYLLMDGQKYGPISTEDIIEHWLQGHIRPEAEIWKGLMEKHGEAGFVLDKLVEMDAAKKGISASTIVRKAPPPRPVSPRPEIPEPPGTVPAVINLSRSRDAGSGQDGSRKRILDDEEEREERRRKKLEAQWELEIIKTSKSAQAAMILGLISFLGLVVFSLAWLFYLPLPFFLGALGFTLAFAIPAIICGHVGERATAQKASLRGRNLARIGIVTGYLGMIICGVVGYSYVRKHLTEGRIYKAAEELVQDFKTIDQAVQKYVKDMRADPSRPVRFFDLADKGYLPPNSRLSRGQPPPPIPPYMRYDMVIPIIYPDETMEVPLSLRQMLDPMIPLDHPMWTIAKRKPPRQPPPGVGPR